MYTGVIRGSGDMLTLSNRYLDKSESNLKTNGNKERNRYSAFQQERPQYTASAPDLFKADKEERVARAFDISVRSTERDQLIDSTSSSSGSKACRGLLLEERSTAIVEIPEDHIAVDNLVREDLDAFIENMVFVFSKLENKLIGPITWKEVLAGFLSYGASTINLAGIASGNYESLMAWVKYLGASLSAGAMYSGAVVSVMKDPVKMSKKIADFRALPKLAKAKITAMMAGIVMLSAYSPMLDAFNAYEGVIKMLGGNVKNPSVMHKAAGFIGGALNWGAESILPILLGLRIMSGVTSDIREVMYADKDSYAGVCERATLFCDLVDRYNQSIAVNNDKSNLVLDVNEEEIVLFNRLLQELNGSPYLLENVIKLIHGTEMNRHPVKARVLGLMKVIGRILTATASGLGLSKIMAMPSILSKLGVSGEVDCDKLRENLANVHINVALEKVKQHSYTAQGLTFMDNLVSLMSSLQILPYAISHTVKHRARNGAVCSPALTTNGLKRLWRTTAATPMRLFGGVLGLGGTAVYTYVASSAIGGAKVLGESTMCANVTIPGIDADEVNSIFYKILTYMAVTLLCFILLGGSSRAWMKMSDRLFPTKKGSSVETRAEYDRRQKEIREISTSSQEGASTSSQEGASTSLKEVASTSLKERSGNSRTKRAISSSPPSSAPNMGISSSKRMHLVANIEHLKRQVEANVEKQVATIEGQLAKFEEDIVDARVEVAEAKVILDNISAQRKAREEAAAAAAMEDLGKAFAQMDADACPSVSQVISRANNVGATLLETDV